MMLKVGNLQHDLKPLQLDLNFIVNNYLSHIFMSLNKDYDFKFNDTSNLVYIICYRFVIIETFIHIIDIKMKFHIFSNQITL